MSNVLVLCPHSDDEIICAGTIAKHKNDNVRLFSLSSGNGKTGSTKDEFLSSMRLLGITDFKLFEFATRYMYEIRQHILQVFCDEKKPDIVYCPATWDCHQDHQVVNQEAIRAFRTSSIYGYEVQHNAVTGGQINHYVKIGKEHLELKRQLLLCYESQSFRTNMNFSRFEALARLRGYQISEQYAEAFQTIRSIKE